MHIIQGNILEFDTGIICHGVNCQGVMGSGLAKEIRKSYPSVYNRYVNRCDRYGNELLGTNQLCYTGSNALYVCNMFTQDKYGRDPDVRYVSYDAVDDCMKSLAESLDDPLWKHTPVYIPKIGAGLGNGDWNVIYQIILTHLKNFENITLVHYD